MSRSILAFDVDHTLVQSNLSLLFGRYLYQNGVLSLYQMGRLIFYYLLAKSGWVTMDTLHCRAARVFMGISFLALEEIVQSFLSTDIPFNSLILKELEGGLSNGDHVALFSTSPDFLIHPLALRLGVSECYATVYAKQADGNFSGEITVFDGRGKADALQELSEKFQIPLDASTAYSDHEADLPFLRRAGQGVVVNPSRRLLMEAKKRGWRVVKS